MRVLHLIDAASSQACPTSLALLGEAMGRLGDIDQQVVALGGAALARDAAHAGLRDVITIGVPYGHAMLGWFGIRARIRQLQPDLVHCWSIGALTLATLMWRDTPRLLTITSPLSPRQIHWLRMLLTHSAATTAFLPISATLRHDLITGGIDETRVHVLRPGIDLGRVAHANRTAIRKAWGITLGESSHRRTIVVALLADPVQAHDVRASAMAVGIAAEAYHPRDSDPAVRVHVVVHPDQRHRLAAQQDMCNLGLPDRIIVDERIARPWEILPACDLAVSTGHGAGGLSLLWAMAANVPIIADASYAASEIVEDHHSALLVKPGQLQPLAHRVNQLIDDPRLAWQLRDIARHECYSFFSRLRYCTSIRTVYDQMMSGRPVEVPPMQSTGGLRFTGRA